MNLQANDSFLGLFDYQWSAIGAIATALAAAVALLLPIALDLRTRSRGRRRDRALLQNIVDGSYLGLITLAQGLTAWYRSDPWGLHQNLSLSSGIRKRLEIYARTASLSDDAIDCCLSVSEALSIFAESASADLMDVLSKHTTREFHAATTVGIHAKTRLKALCVQNRIGSRFQDDAEGEMNRAISAMNKIPLDPRIETDS